MRCKSNLLKYLAGNFWQNFNAADARGHAKISAILAIFYSYDRGPAAHPLSFTVGEFRRENQDHFQLAPSDNTRVGIEKHSARIQIASEAGGRDRPALGLDGDRHARRNALPGAAFTLDVRHEEWSVPQLRG